MKVTNIDTALLIDTDGLNEHSAVIVSDNRLSSLRTQNLNLVEREEERVDVTKQ